MTTNTSNNDEHKHSWIRADSESDKIICEKCNIDFDEWHEKMTKKGYTDEQMRRFENE